MRAERWGAVGVALFLFLAGGGIFAAGVVSTSDPAPVRGLLMVCGALLIVGAVYGVRHVWASAKPGEGKT